VAATYTLFTTLTEIIRLNQGSFLRARPGLAEFRFGGLVLRLLLFVIADASLLMRLDIMMLLH